MLLPKTWQRYWPSSIVVVSALGGLIVAACQAPDAGQNLYIPTASAAGSDTAVELLIRQRKQTSRADVFRLVEALDEGYELLDLARPYPTIRLANPSHRLLQYSSGALAAKNAGGQEFIYFDRNRLSNKQSLRPLVLHELAHLKAWRLHGIEIAEHGPEFRKVCHSATTRRNCAAK